MRLHLWEPPLLRYCEHGIRRETGHVRAPVRIRRFHPHEPCRLPTALWGRRAITHAATKHELVAPAAAELDGAEHVLPVRDLNPS